MVLKVPLMLDANGQTQTGKSFNYLLSEAAQKLMETKN
jgi:hypothetical protein